MRTLVFDEHFQAFNLHLKLFDLELSVIGFRRFSASDIDHSIETFLVGQRLEFLLQHMVLVLEYLHLLLQFLHLELNLISLSIRFLFCVFHILASLMES